MGGKITDHIKKVHIVICEGEPDYKVCDDHEKAMLYAQNRAYERPGTHWLVAPILYGYVWEKETENSHD